MAMATPMPMMLSSASSPVVGPRDQMLCPHHQAPPTAVVSGQGRAAAGAPRAVARDQGLLVGRYPGQCRVIGFLLGQQLRQRRRNTDQHKRPGICGARASVTEEGTWADQQQWQHMEDVYDSLAQRILSLAQATPQGQKTLVALAGPPGAGKSTVAHEVIDRVNNPQRRQATPSEEPLTLAVAVPMDGFHLYRWQLDCMPDPKEAHARRGAPWTFDPAALYRHLKRILDQGSGFLPSFNHGVGDPVERDIFVDPGVRVVLVEGNYLLLPNGDWAKLRGLFTETWFLDVDVDEAMQRVEARHIRTGKPPEVARFRISYNDRPNAVSIMTTKQLADIVVPSIPLREPQ